MNIERAMVMLDFLEAPERLGGCPDADFNMDNWECGTQACFGGWAARIFHHSGLRFQGKPGLYGRRPTYKGALCYVAIADFFGIEYSAGLAITSPGAPDSREAVASRFRKIIESELE